MADIQAFRAVRFDSGAGDLAALTSPPYDVISAQDRDALEALHPRNVVRLILGRDEPGDGATHNKYTRAAETLSAWLREGALVEDAEDALYVYEQAYDIGGRRRVQRGLLAAVSLDEDSVLPHERTMDAPVGDRMELMRTTATNLEPILCVYSGEDGPGREAIAAVVRMPPVASFATGDGIEHRLWAVRDSGAIAAIRDALAGVRLVIADGHHRYRTARQYRDERRAADGPGAWDRMMMMLLDAEWAGPSLLAIHRTVSGTSAGDALARLAGAFEIEPAGSTDAALLEAELGRRREAARTYAMADGEEAWFLTLSDKEAASASMPAEHSAAWRDLDVAVLHSLVFDHLLGVEPAYAHSAAEAMERARAGEATLAFLLAPTPFDAVRRVAEAREAMPPKSTYFYPKPRTGVVMRLLG